MMHVEEQQKEAGHKQNEEGMIQGKNDTQLQNEGRKVTGMKKGKIQGTIKGDKKKVDKRYKERTQGRKERSI